MDFAQTLAHGLAPILAVGNIAFVGAIALAFMAGLLVLAWR